MHSFWRILLRIDLNEIVYFEGDGNLTYIFTANKLKGIVSMNLGKLEGYLATEYLALTEWTEDTFPQQYVDVVAAPTEELTVPQFTTLLKDGSEIDTAEENPAEPAATETVTQ